MNIFKELPIAFPWYENVNLQNRFRSNADLTDWGLISPIDALLPFQFWKVGGTGEVTTWEILNPNGTHAHTIDAADLALVRTATREGRIYLYYAGEPLHVTGGDDLELEPGLYYSRIVTADAQEFFSEMIMVPSCAFLSTDTVDNPFLKLEWYNNSDLRPIFYNDLDGEDIPYFRNIVYLDTDAYISIPEIEEDAIQDGRGEEIPTFQKAYQRFQIADLVPDFLVRALGLLPMHDVLILTWPKAWRTGEIDKVTVEAAPQLSGGFQTVTLTWEEELVTIKKGCADNMT